jgi:hypothetical protein
VEQELTDILTDQVINGEVLVSQTNQQYTNDDFEDMIALLDAERQDKNYDWQSDIRIPEFASHVLTQSSIDVSQYFQTRDFVEVYLQDESDEAKASSNAAKELINRTLNQKHLYHYLKFLRGKALNNVVGRVYAKCWWEQETQTQVVGFDTQYEDLDVDEYGDALTSEDQVPARRETEIPIEDDVPIFDRFNYDIWDQRNVFTDNSYVYSLQDKQWVTFRSEMTYSELKEVEVSNEYFNLETLKDVKPPIKTEFAAQAADKDQSTDPVKSAVEKAYDIYERYGKFWILPDKTGQDAIGLDKQGKPLEKAVLAEAIITVAVAGTVKTLIGFKPTNFIDSRGFTYRPVIRGLCYVHLTEDGGVGDGKYTKELQIAIDDTFNISQDRVMLATLPTFAVNKTASDDNSSLYFEPGHAMEFNDPSKDFKEFKISDNITGALNQINMLVSKMQQVDSVQPPSLGDSGPASGTATAYAGASYATGERSNYKSLTFENTFLLDLYWMIQQMTFAYAKSDTGIELMGEKVYDFDPSKPYYYKPVSQAIEPEYSKIAKRKEWTTLLGYVIQLVGVHPDAVKMVNYIIAEYTKLMGDEQSNVVPMLLGEDEPIAPQGGAGAPGANIGGAEAMAVSNQAGVPMSGAEMGTRGIANIGAF